MSQIGLIYFYLIWLNVGILVQLTIRILLIKIVLICINSVLVKYFLNSFLALMSFYAVTKR